MVKDQGIGIKKENYELIFKSFRQEGTQKVRKYGGTGLGLSIVKGLFERLKGEIWIENELGKGSAFYFNLPIK